MSLSLDPTPPQPPRGGGGGVPSGTVAPEAPGRLGVPVEVNAAFAYLRDLGVWVAKRKEELDALDAVALASSERDRFSRDMMVALALWKAIHDRYDLLTVTFDSGRVGPTEAQRLSTLIWGRLDVQPGSAADQRIAPATSGALGLSLPEACRLCDAMTSSLRARLSLEPTGAEVGTRLKDTRATIERIRDQIGMLPVGERDAARSLMVRLEQRLEDVTERAKRGAEVGGLLAPLEFDAANTERDLIVGAGERLEAARDAERARVQVTELAARAEALHDLVEQTVAAVTPAPRLGVPDVHALGPVPTAPRELTAYLARLDAVSRALTQVHTAYSDALAGRDEVEGYSGAVAAQARAAGIDDEDSRALLERLQTVLASRPTDVTRARALAAAYQAYVGALTTPTSTTPPKGAR